MPDRAADSLQLRKSNSVGGSVPLHLYNHTLGSVPDLVPLHRRSEIDVFSGLLLNVLVPGRKILGSVCFDSLLFPQT